MKSVAGSAQMELPPDPAIGRVARHFIRQVLGDWGAPAEIVDKAVMVATELASNALLHALPPFVLTLDDRPDTVRVGLRDCLALTPTLRDYGSLALTGRGLRLVALNSRGWGVVGSDHGKEVWADVADGPTGTEVKPMQIEGQPVPTPPEPAGGSSGAASVVYFQQTPVVAYLSLQERNDAVFRECALLAGMGSVSKSVPPALLALARRMNDHFAGARDYYRDTVAAAHARGETTIDLEQALDPGRAIEAVEAAKSYLALMDRLDDFCREQTLLAEPASDLIVWIRRWFVSEMRAQLIDGLAPTPFRFPVPRP